MADPLSLSTRTPEQQAAVRRRSLPIAIAGLICGIAGIAMLILQQPDATHPPPIVPVNLSFCAMMMGIGIFFYAKGTPGVRPALIVCGLAIAVGFAGPIVFARLGINWRKAIETRELDNVAAIANAARQYAADNGGVFPQDILTLLDQHRLSPDNLHSPFASNETIDNRQKLAAPDFEKWFARHSDYEYYGADLRQPPATLPAGNTVPLPANILVAAGNDPIMRVNLAVSFADGSSRYITLEEAEQTLKDSNKSRVSLGLPELRPPDSIERARKAERADKAANQ